MNAEARFANAEANGTGFSRVGAEYPHELFVGVEDGKRALLLVAAQPCTLDIPQLSSLFVVQRLRADGKWALLVRLERDELKGLFSHLADDLICQVQLGNVSRPAIDRLVARLNWWKRLFGGPGRGILSDSELRGLVAELHFLVGSAIPNVGVSAAVHAWRGPLDSPRDFQFPDREVEIKATSRGSDWITISSPEQLTEGACPLIVGVLPVEIVQSTSAPTVSALVDGARTACVESSDASDALDHLLLAAGYLRMPEYDRIQMLVGEFRYFNVSGEFPRLTRAVVPIGIGKVTYELRLSSIAPWEVPTWI